LSGTPEEQERMQSLFGQKLGLSEDQMKPLGELVCATMVLREALLADYAGGLVEADRTWQEMTVMREELTSRMELELGPERYTEFRAAGGIGALASAIVCEQAHR
jgi:hypothetical protein